MFDPGVAHTLSGARIDAPHNALLLQHDLHAEFGKLHLYFDPIQAAPDSYHVRTTRGTALPPFLLPPGPPPVVTFANHEAAGVPRSGRPCRRLLKLHMACCKMLEMAAAAEYVERLLNDVDQLMERGSLAADGSSPVGAMLAMRGLQDSAEWEVVDDRGVAVA